MVCKVLCSSRSVAPLRRSLWAPKAFAFASAMFLAAAAYGQDTSTTTAAPGQEASTTPAAPPQFTPTGRIACHGVSEIPMTADEAQSLPLNLVANLACGQQVAVLSSADAYTVKVQTADGQSGYIASMYLTKLPTPPPKLDMANLRNGVARWSEGAPGCDYFMSSDGSWVESITVNGVSVQASLYDTGWKLRAQVAVVNDSAAPVSIDPAKFVLDEIGELGRPLFYQDPAELAKNKTHQVLWTETVAVPYTQSRPAVSPFPGTQSANYKVAIRSDVSSPNYLLLHQDAENDAVRAQGDHTILNYAKQVQALALKSGTVAPNSTASGAVWFERSKTPDQLILRIPIESVSYEFRLSFKHHK